MKTCSSEKCEQLLRESSSKEDYQESVKELISSTLSSSFSYDERIASRLSRHTEKNLMLQDFQQTFLPPHLQNQLQDPRVASLNPELKRFMQLLDHSSEQKTSSELQDLRKSFQKLNRYLQEPQKLAQLSDPVLKSRLQGLYEAKQSSTPLQTRSKAILSFFSLFTSQEFN